MKHCFFWDCFMYWCLKLCPIISKPLTTLHPIFLCLQETTVRNTESRKPVVTRESLCGVYEEDVTALTRCGSDSVKGHNDSCRNDVSNRWNSNGALSSSQTLWCYCATQQKKTVIKWIYYPFFSKKYLINKCKRSQNCAKAAKVHLVFPLLSLRDFFSLHMKVIFLKDFWCWYRAGTFFETEMLLFSFLSFL